MEEEHSNARVFLRSIKILKTVIQEDVWSDAAKKVVAEAAHLSETASEAKECACETVMKVAKAEMASRGIISW